MKSVGFTEGVLIGMRCSSTERKYFDWLKAVKLIREHGIKNAKAGLDGDWNETNAMILVDGEILQDDEDSIPYFASPWAAPKLLDCDTLDEYECWTDEEAGDWEDNVAWPERAVRAFRKGAKNNA